jgi:hypothetical protein
MPIASMIPFVSETRNRISMSVEGPCLPQYHHQKERKPTADFRT